VALALLVAGALCGSAAASQPASLGAAREVLVLTRDRLDLMEEVMAAKWFSRSPIQDPAQEATVTEAAIAKARALGVAASGTRGLFEAEIAAAKEVELGWGAHWLFFGAPPDLAAPELETLRTELSAISERIVAVLPRLVPLSRDPEAAPRLRRAGARILRVAYLTGAGREPIVGALSAIRRIPAG
jgi:chorismate mutase-like protein